MFSRSRLNFFKDGRTIGHFCSNKLQNCKRKGSNPSTNLCKFNMLFKATGCPLSGKRSDSPSSTCPCPGRSALYSGELNPFNVILVQPYSLEIAVYLHINCPTHWSALDQRDYCIVSKKEIITPDVNGTCFNKEWSMDFYRSKALCAKDQALQVVNIDNCCQAGSGESLLGSVTYQTILWPLQWQSRNRENWWKHLVDRN